MTLPTEPIGSLPRSKALQEAMQAAATGRLSQAELDAQFDAAVRDTLVRFEETGSTVVTDGEQRKQSFATYPIAGASNIRPGGVTIPFEDGHTRQLPLLTGGPFRYATKASAYLEAFAPLTSAQPKQAVISASALSLLYPSDGLADYPRDQFIADLVAEARSEIKECLARGAIVQIDFTEARLSLKLDPSGGLLNAFVDLNNQVLADLADDERRRVGVHTCPGGDQDSTHSADVPYEQLLPALFRMNVGNFYVMLSGEPDRRSVLRVLGEQDLENRRVFVGVTDPISPRVETAQEVRDQVLEAAEFIDPAHLGTTDDCGFSPFGDDTSTSRDTAFAKIKARVDGTRMASEQLGV
jgi:5-methyltetrahydropteroyltriglutamate--homocysteine methyltransferase